MNRFQPEKTLQRVLSRNTQTNAEPAVVTRSFYEAKVIRIDDPLNSKRIKARIEGIDSGILDEDLPWCQSLYPPFLYFLPQIDEMVLIFLQNPWNRVLGRFYLGPIMTGDYTDKETYSEAIKNIGKTQRGEI